MIIQWSSEFDGVQMLWQMLSGLLLLICLLPACLGLTVGGQGLRTVLAASGDWLGLIVVHSTFWIALLFSLAMGPSAGTTPQQSHTTAPIAMEDMIREANQVVDQRHLFGRGGILGDLEFAGLRNLEVQGNAERPLFASRRPYHSISLATFLTYHLAVYLCALLTVMAVASRGNAKPSRLLIFSILWGVFVYAPAVHWVWGEGWLGIRGTIDDGGSLFLFVVGVSIIGVFQWCGKTRKEDDPSANSPYENLILHGSSIAFTLGYLVLMCSIRVPDSHIRAVVVLNGIISACSGFLLYSLLKLLIPNKSCGHSPAIGFCCGIVSVAAGCTMFDPRTAVTCSVFGTAAGFAAWALTQRLHHPPELEFPVATVAASAAGLLFVGVCGSSANGVFQWNQETISSLMHGDASLLGQQAKSVVAIFVLVFGISRLLAKVCLASDRQAH